MKLFCSKLIIFAVPGSNHIVLVCSYKLTSELKLARRLAFKIMDLKVTPGYELYIDDTENSFVVHENEMDVAEFSEVKDSVRNRFFISLLRSMTISLKAYVLRGILFGLSKTLFGGLN